VVLTLEGTERLDTDFEKGAIDIVKRKKTDEGAERYAACWKRPVGDQIEFRFGRAVAVGSDVVTDILNAVS
jgi:hypothetical protein